MTVREFFTSEWYLVTAGIGFPLAFIAIAILAYAIVEIRSNRPTIEDTNKAYRAGLRDGENVGRLKGREDGLRIAVKSIQKLSEGGKTNP